MLYGLLCCRFDDVVGDQICPLDVELKWMTEISSSIYATPLITDLYADGRKDIIVPGFVHYTEVLEGPDGAKALGWPGFHRSTVHSSPLLHDIDSDGIRDIVVATYDGDIVFFRDNVSGRTKATTGGDDISPLGSFLSQRSAAGQTVYASGCGWVNRQTSIVWAVQLALLG